MRTQNVIIHVGLSKCASTFLQKCIFPQFGNYSNIAFAPDLEKYYLFRKDMDADTYRNIVNRHLINPDRNSHHLIISCEDYTELLFRGFEQLFFQRQTLDREQYYFSNKLITENLARVYPSAKIILVIRVQIDWAISRHKMNYRGGIAAAEIDDYLGEPLEGYDITIQRYYDYFGRDNVLVLPYEKLLADQHEFLDSLCRFVMPGLSIQVPENRVNTGPDLQRIVEYERYKNRTRQAVKNTCSTSSLYRTMLLALNRLLAGMLKPFFFIRYGNSKFEVKPSQSTKSRLSSMLRKTNNEVEKLTGLELSRYGYLTDRY